MASLKDLVSEYEPDKCEEFARWAFGENYLVLCGRMSFLDAWNELHGELLMLHGDGHPSKDIPKMIDLWRKSNG